MSFLGGGVSIAEAGTSMDPSGGCMADGDCAHGVMRNSASELTIHLSQQPA